MVEKLSDVQVNRHQIDSKSIWAVQLSRALLRQASSSWDGETPSDKRRQRHRFCKWLICSNLLPSPHLQCGIGSTQPI